LVAFGYHVQDAEYATNWKKVRSFWLQLLPLIRDARLGDVILFQFGDTKHGVVPITQGFTQHEMAVYYSLAFPKLVQSGEVCAGPWRQPALVASPRWDDSQSYRRGQSWRTHPVCSPYGFSHEPLSEDVRVVLDSVRAG
jgi:hypothetical protein